MDIIARKDNRAYDNFIKILRNDYEWLVKDILNSHDEHYDVLEQEALQDTLVLGDVPRRPPHYVDRTSPVSSVRRAFIIFYYCLVCVLLKQR